MHGHARHDLVLAVVKRGAPRKNLTHHGDDVVGLERHAQYLVAHAAAGRIGHLAILQVIARLREQVVIAAMVVVQMADDDGCDRFRRDAERQQPIAHRLDHLALAPLPHGLVEAGIDHDGAGRPDDGPDEVVERLQHVMQIAVDEIRRRPARVVAVADGKNLVDVVAHR
jgi:hypothetical protein